MIEFWTTLSSTGDQNYESYHPKIRKTIFENADTTSILGHTMLLTFILFRRISVTAWYLRHWRWNIRVKTFLSESKKWNFSIGCYFIVHFRLRTSRARRTQFFLQEATLKFIDTCILYSIFSLELFTIFRFNVAKKQKT